jgi:hypothetical protein
MTGRDLIIYILENNLEDELVYKDGKFVGYMTVAEAAMTMDVGAATIYTMMNQEMLDYIIVGNSVFIPETFMTLKMEDNKK